MNRHTYRYRGRWNRRARNRAKMLGVRLAPCYVRNSWPCRESKRRYSWITVNGDTWRFKNPRPTEGAYVAVDMPSPRSESGELSAVRPRRLRGSTALT